MKTVRRKKLMNRLESNPPLFFLTAYLLTIIAGGLLLSTPIAFQNGRPPSFIDPFFLATSAVCVTGLSPVVTCQQWSLFGQIMIVCLIQLGGLGIMTTVGAFGLAMDAHFGMNSRLLIKEEKGSASLDGMIRLTQFILAMTFGIELIGVVLLGIYFVPRLGFARGLWTSIFHSISAFCNAGFDILSDTSLMPYNQNAWLLLVLSFLIITGGLGYVVFSNLLDLHSHRRLSLHTRIVLSLTAILLVSGTLLIFLSEHDNPLTLGPMPLGKKWLNAFFQSVTTRTCGFFSIDQSKLRGAAYANTLTLMFIGGAPASTAGGVKLTTIAAVFLGAIAEIRPSGEAPVFHRNVASAAIRKAFVIFFVALVWCLLMTYLLTLTEPAADIKDLFFETISAFGTVGLSRNLTPVLSGPGKIFMMMTMLFGKLGPMAILYILLPRDVKKKNHLAEENILVG